MQTVAIRDLKTNPSVLSKPLENGEHIFITKRNKPIGITLPLSDRIFKSGLVEALAIDAWHEGSISLGKLAAMLQKDKLETMQMLSDLGYEPIDYDLNDDLKTLTTLAAQ